MPRLAACAVTFAAGLLPAGCGAASPKDRPCVPRFSAARAVHDLRASGIDPKTLSTPVANGRRYYFALDARTHVALGVVVVARSKSDAAHALTLLTGPAIWQARYTNVFVRAPSAKVRGMNRLRVIRALAADKRVCAS